MWRGPVACSRRQGAAAAQGHASSRWDRGPGVTPEHDRLTADCCRRAAHAVGMHACRRVQAAIAEAHQPCTGSVRQALCGALYEEVTDFYRLIAVLEGHLSAPMPTPGASGWAVGGHYVGRWWQQQQQKLEHVRRYCMLVLVDCSFIQHSAGALSCMASTHQSV